MIENIENIHKFTFLSGAYWIESPYVGECYIEIDKRKLIAKYVFKSNFYNT